MRRATVVRVVLLALAILATARGTTAQPPAKVARLGLLSTASPTVTAAVFAPFLQGLRDLGYVEGQHLIVETRYAEGDLDRLPALAAELARLPLDVLVVAGTPSTLAAKHATTTIPIVFFGTADPVGRGLVASLARPGGNLTGVAADSGPGLAAKRLELLKAAVPTVSRVAMLWGRVDASTEADAQARERAARMLGLTLRDFTLRRLEEFAAWVFPAIAADTPGIEALHATGPLVIEYQREIAAFALQHRLPLVGTHRTQADAGALLAYGPPARAMQQRAAVFVDKILHGARPAELPVEQPCGPQNYHYYPLLASGYLRLCSAVLTSSRSKASGSNSPPTHSSMFSCSGCCGSWIASRKPAYPQIPPQSSGGQARLPVRHTG